MRWRDLWDFFCSAISVVHPEHKTRTIYTYIDSCRLFITYISFQLYIDLVGKFLILIICKEELDCTFNLCFGAVCKKKKKSCKLHNQCSFHQNSSSIGMNDNACKTCLKCTVLRLQWMKSTVLWMFFIGVRSSINRFFFYFWW